MNQINFGENVRKIRTMRDYKQEYMAEKLGFKHQNRYSRIENSSEIPAMEIVNRIAEILEISVAELLTPQVRLDTPERQKARIGIYTGITYFIAVGIGIICADPAFQYVDGFCSEMAIPEGWLMLYKMVGGFVPLTICLWSARKISRRYKAAYGIE